MRWSAASHSRRAGPTRDSAQLALADNGGIDASKQSENTAARYAETFTRHQMRSSSSLTRSYMRAEQRAHSRPRASVRWAYISKEPQDPGYPRGEVAMLTEQCLDYEPGTGFNTTNT